MSVMLHRGRVQLSNYEDLLFIYMQEISYPLCSHHDVLFLSGMSGLGQIGPKVDTSGICSDQFSVHFGSASYILVPIENGSDWPEIAQI